MSFIMYTPCNGRPFSTLSCTQGFRNEMQQMKEQAGGGKWTWKVDDVMGGVS